MYRNLKLSMRFFWVKLHIKFAFHCRDPNSFGVKCPWIFYNRTYACNSFLGFFTTPFHIGTWNFPWGFSELSYTSSSRFIVVTPIVSELSALGFYYRIYACNIFPCFFYTVSYRNLKLSMRFFWVKLRIEFTFHHCDPYGFGVTCPWIYHYRTYACNSFPGVFFYIVSYRNLKLLMRFFWVKLHIKFAFFHLHDPYGFGVTCP
jgi:hypothetical protein